MKIKKLIILILVLFFFLSSSDNAAYLPEITSTISTQTQVLNELVTVATAALNPGFEKPIKIPIFDTIPVDDVLLSESCRVIPPDSNYISHVHDGFLYSSSYDRTRLFQTNLITAEEELIAESAYPAFSALGVSLRMLNDDWLIYTDTRRCCLDPPSDYHAINRHTGEDRIIVREVDRDVSTGKFHGVYIGSSSLVGDLFFYTLNEWRYEPWGVAVSRIEQIDLATNEVSTLKVIHNPTAYYYEMVAWTGKLAVQKRANWIDSETFQIEILDLETGQMTLLGKDLPKGEPVLSYPYLLYLQYRSEGKFPHYVLYDLKTKEEFLLPISRNNYHPKVVGGYIFWDSCPFWSSVSRSVLVYSISQNRFILLETSTRKTCDQSAMLDGTTLYWKHHSDCDRTNQEYLFCSLDLEYLFRNRNDFTR